MNELKALYYRKRISDMTKSNFKLFREAVTRKVCNNPEISAEDLYFSQTKCGYYAEYRPAFPNETPADFIVYQDLNGSVSLYCNFGALIPTKSIFENLTDFEFDL